jgi:hypothetical protein
MHKKPPERPAVSIRWRKQDYRILFVLMSVFSELFLSLMSRDLMFLSFSSTRHNRAPYPLGYLNQIVITLALCDVTSRRSSGYVCIGDFRLLYHSHPMAIVFK